MFQTCSSLRTIKVFCMCELFVQLHKHEYVCELFRNAALKILKVIFPRFDPRFTKTHEFRRKPVAARFCAI